jgi:hypothetical protein
MNRDYLQNRLTLLKGSVMLAGDNFFLVVSIDQNICK